MQNRLNKKFFLLLLFRCFLSNSRFRPIATPQIVNSSSQNVSLNHCKPPFAHSPTFTSAHHPLVFAPSDVPLSFQLPPPPRARILYNSVRHLPSILHLLYNAQYFRGFWVKAKCFSPSPKGISVPPFCIAVKAVKAKNTT